MDSTRIDEVEDRSVEDGEEEVDAVRRGLEVDGDVNVEMKSVVRRDDLDLGRRRRRKMMEWKVDGRHTTTRFPREWRKRRELGDRDVMLWRCWRMTLV